MRVRRCSRATYGDELNRGASRQEKFREIHVATSAEPSFGVTVHQACQEVAVAIQKIVLARGRVHRYRIATLVRPSNGPDDFRSRADELNHEFLCTRQAIARKTLISAIIVR